MSETILGLIGIFMFYTWGHFMYISFNTIYKDRSGYEKFITWCAIITLALYIIGTV